MNHSCKIYALGTFCTSVSRGIFREPCACPPVGGGKFFVIMSNVKKIMLKFGHF